MNVEHTQEFREEAVRLVLEGRGSVRQIGADLGVNVWTLRGWVKKYREQSRQGQPPRPETLAEENRRLRRENAVLREEREIQKSGGVLREGAAVRYALLAAHRREHTANRLCRVLKVSRSGWYAWSVRPPS